MIDRIAWLAVVALAALTIALALASTTPRSSSPGDDSGSLIIAASWSCDPCWQ